MASDDPLLLDEVVRFLEEIPHWEALAVETSTVDEMTQELQSASPDALLISEGLVRGLVLAGRRGLEGPARVVMIGRELAPEALRAAILIGARASIRWPQDRHELKAAVEEGLQRAPRRRPAGGGMTGLWGPKGGSGTSVLAAHLAAALAGLSSETALVDLDLDHGDQSALLGAPEELKGLPDLLRVVDELTPKALEGASWQHPRGFRAILTPAAPWEGGLVKEVEVVQALAGIREHLSQVVVDLPSGFSDLVFTVAEETSHLVLVVNPTFLSLRRAREAVKALATAGVPQQRLMLVLNGAGGSAITPADLEGVLGLSVGWVIRTHVALERAPDRGQMEDAGVRLLEPLARRILGLPQVAAGGIKGFFRR